MNSFEFSFNFHQSEIWGWLEVRRSAINSLQSEPVFVLRVTLGEPGWLWVERWQLCLWNTSRSAKCHRRVSVGHQILLSVRSVVGWLIVYQLGILSQYSLYRLLTRVRWCPHDDACLGVRNTSSIGAWPNSLDRRPPWYCSYSIPSVTNKNFSQKSVKNTYNNANHSKNQPW